MMKFAKNILLYLALAALAFNLTACGLHSEEKEREAARQRLRQYRAESPLPEDEALTDPAPLPEQAAERRERDEAVRSAVEELDPAVRFMTDMMTRMKLNGRNSDSKIAGMMIEGNTKGMIKGLKNLHQFAGQDEKINILSQKLLDCETANIRQMQGFL